MRGGIRLFQYAIFGFLFALCASVSAQTYPQWGNLKPGPYAVGFKVNRKSITFISKRPEANGIGRGFLSLEIKNAQGADKAPPR